MKKLFLVFLLCLAPALAEVEVDFLRYNPNLLFPSWMQGTQRAGAIWVVVQSDNQDIAAVSITIRYELGGVKHKRTQAAPLDQYQAAHSLFWVGADIKVTAIEVTELTAVASQEFQFP
jgi:hypothetical protein